MFQDRLYGSRCRVIRSQTVLADRNDLLRRCPRFLVKQFQNHHRVVVRAVNEAPLRAFILDPQRVAARGSRRRGRLCGNSNDSPPCSRRNSRPASMRAAAEKGGG
jgi:hypothetical protein